MEDVMGGDPDTERFALFRKGGGDYSSAVKMPPMELVMEGRVVQGVDMLWRAAHRDADGKMTRGPFLRTVEVLTDIYPCMLVLLWELVSSGRSSLAYQQFTDVLWVWLATICESDLTVDSIVNQLAILHEKLLTSSSTCDPNKKWPDPIVAPVSYNALYRVLPTAVLLNPLKGVAVSYMDCGQGWETGLEEEEEGDEEDEKETKKQKNIRPTTMKTPQCPVVTEIPKPVEPLTRWRLCCNPDILSGSWIPHRPLYPKQFVRRASVGKLTELALVDTCATKRFKPPKPQQEEVLKPLKPFEPAAIIRERARRSLTRISSSTSYPLLHRNLNDMLAADVLF
eukprot:TRINITY_DN359_c3_g1_i2.p1 TRINITY_DN359_c3_g1~~TRINITY_DN359_c3_g1_i2.p1  ORF type:complete len:339 (+),score=54.40 TRINITY_DN359_c3_g1_i2:68-1084(+)